MNAPRKVFSYDATELYLTNRLRVVVVPMLDLGSRKFLHYGIRVASFTQRDVMDIWDEALWKEDIDASQLTAISDRKILSWRFKKDGRITIPKKRRCWTMA
ncbi:MAG: hypothetical protein Q8Q92_04575 [bacterium]|nr:hypothetical protein [bacterium]